MKKLLLLGLLGLVALHTSAQEAQAWGWLRHKCCCSKYSTTLNIKPYNAFSPVAYGSIVADGCMPVNMYGGCAPQQPSCFAPGCAGGACYGPACASNGMFEGGIMPAPGSYTTMPAPGSFTTMPVQMVPAAPIPVNQTGYNWNMPISQATGYNGVQPIGYSVGYQPAVNPYAGYMQQPFQAPSYWYGR